MFKTDYKLLSGNGNIGFYQSCEVTQLFLNDRKKNSVTNFYLLVCFEEKPYTGLDHQFLCKPITVNEQYSLGIQRYNLSLSEAEKNFDLLIEKKKWDYSGTDSLIIGNVRLLPKQFVPTEDGQRLSLVLKNNFYNGAYLLEFFDDKKEDYDFLLSNNDTSLLNKINSKIKDVLPIDLSVVRDRIGNIVFQFPVNLFELSTKSLSGWDGINLNFTWHHLITSIPDAYIQVESILDNNYMGNEITEYSKANSQEIVIGNLDRNKTLKIYRRSPNLLVYSSKGSYMRTVTVTSNMLEQEKRRFKVEGEEVEVEVYSSHEFTIGKEKFKTQVVTPEYLNYVDSSLYSLEADKLEATLAFKQYFAGDRELALNNIRDLVNRHGENGVYLWDPFLRSKDILETIIYCKSAFAPLLAIGSISPTVKLVYEEKGKTAIDIISEQRYILENDITNKFGLNLEYRMQYEGFGWGFHDRFLIFPEKGENKSKVYSLGTSVNSLGKSHHILYEISHPQRVIDAFNELWRKIDNPNCLVWKSL